MQFPLSLAEGEKKTLLSGRTQKVSFAALLKNSCPLLRLEGEQIHKLTVRIMVDNSCDKE
jgi:hypothetical protein